MDNLLEIKKRELNRLRESFDIYTQNNLFNEGNFEGSAISMLLEMARVKSEIKILETK